MKSNLEILKEDRESHIARREQLASDEGGHFIKREGYPVSGVVASYDKIIASIDAEIAEIENKAAARKNAKKTPIKKTPTKKK